METANFSSSNIEFIIKPRKARELNIKYDFKHLNRVLKRMSDYKSCLITKKTSDGCLMEVEESGNKKSKYYNEFNETKENLEKNNNSLLIDDGPSFGDYIIKELIDGFFHVKAKVQNFDSKPNICKSKGNSITEKFDILLVFKGAQCIYIYYLKKTHMTFLKN